MPGNALRAGPVKGPARIAAAQLPAKETERDSEPRVTGADAALRRAAYQSAGRGWHVFPTAPGRKTPRRGLPWPAAACADLTRLAAASWRPGEGYAVATKPSGLVVLDLDRRKPGYVLPPAWQDVPGITDGADVLAELCERAGQPWPATYWVRTPTGGSHLYYRAIPGRPVGNSQGRLGPMIDVRGGGDSDGGYVVGPGTVIDERAYPGDPVAAGLVRGGRAYEVIHDQAAELLPAWIADLLDPAAQEPDDCQRPGSARMPAELAPDAYQRMRGVLNRLAGARPGEGRNALLHWSACRFAELVERGEIDAATAMAVLYDAAEANGHVAKHGERATRATITSGMRRAAA
ncbi:MAG TPA: bifunctional DNA primase/polymerase [Streptosporangiaceae bacterium]|nr:bifunctional DNA primase/polymerase [Streptosporangiaceae bacterium]